MIRYAWKRFLKMWHLPLIFFVGRLIGSIYLNTVSAQNNMFNLLEALVFGINLLIFVSILEYFYYAYLTHRANKLGGKVAVGDIYNARYLFGMSIDYIFELGGNFTIVFKRMKESKNG